MSLFPPDVIAAAKERYRRLKAAGQSASGDFAARLAAAPKEPPPIPDEAVVFRDTIPARWYWHGLVKRGEALRLVNAGTLGVPLLLWNARDPSERLNPADTLKIQWTARISTGRVLLSDMGRALASVTFDGFGFCDGVAGCSSGATQAAGPGGAPVFNARDHFIKVAAKHGLSRRDVGPCISFFAPVVTDANGRLCWDAARDPAGTAVDLRMEMDVVAAVANCPHPLAPAGEASAAPLEVVHFRAPPPDAHDLARTGTEEAKRAFENTDHLFGAGRRLS